MTEENKKKTLENIESMVPNDVTNLWHGILEGINLFKKASDTQTGRVPAVMILTDGLPNHMSVIRSHSPLLLPSPGFFLLLLVTYYLNARQTHRNCRNPEQGFVPKLRSKAPIPAALHTFGFGYSLRSGLLKSIAEVGGGNYAFIPDAGMIVRACGDKSFSLLLVWSAR